MILKILQHPTPTTPAHTRWIEADQVALMDRFDVAKGQDPMDIYMSRVMAAERELPPTGDVPTELWGIFEQVGDNDSEDETVHIVSAGEYQFIVVGDVDVFLMGTDGQTVDRIA